MTEYVSSLSHMILSNHVGFSVYFSAGTNMKFALYADLKSMTSTENSYMGSIAICPMVLIFF